LKIKIINEDEWIESEVVDVKSIILYNGGIKTPIQYNSNFELCEFTTNKHELYEYLNKNW